MDLEKVHIGKKKFFCRDCTHLDMTGERVAYSESRPYEGYCYPCLWLGLRKWENNRACEHFLDKSTYKKELGGKMEIERKKCFSVGLATTNGLEDTASTKNFGYIEVEAGRMVVFANDVEEVGRMFPEAIEIKLLGIAYAPKTNMNSCLTKLDG